MGTKVRRAHLDDVPEMVELGEGFWLQTKYYADGIEYSPEDVAHMFSFIIDNDGIAQIAVADGKIVGFLMAIVTPFLFNAEYKSAAEIAYYVHPDYRKGGAGIRLIRQAENVGRQLGLKYLNMVHMDDVNPERPDAVYKKLDYTLNETVFTKEL